eukprot:TRINITY_DN11946_c0_g1_i1.p1 TRINITY_DN11946_c0_g1~~TRINITY_DN11946_c0_g1_i1.p1  ORF type:complete len:254 (+),score=19.03 TRINITY_DN11946_c0_g1_i1:85-846(+)
MIDDHRLKRQIPIHPTSPPKKRSRPNLIEHKCEVDLGYGSSVLYEPQAVSQTQAAAWFEKLMDEVEWAQYDVLLAGKYLSQPRLSCYFSDDDLPPFSYSQFTTAPCSWFSSPCMLQIKKYIERTTGDVFNSAVANLYRDGSDGVGFHSDADSLYGPSTTIASLSLGSTRDFVVREIGNHLNQMVFRLGNGDLLLMQGTMQRHWQHAVPKRSKAGPRINLTFRKILPEYSHFKKLKVPFDMPAKYQDCNPEVPS